MKIVKHGNDPNKVIWIAKCSYCGCIVECCESELSNIYNGDYRNDYTPYSIENCPEPFCKQNIVFNKKSDIQSK